MDTEILEAIKNEENRQAHNIELIPSENYASPAVRQACGSVFTNKYSEGYPGKRYYAGQAFTDQVETLAIERAKGLFGAKYANVQPHSGSNANLAVYFASLQLGDTVLGMDLSHGGHLTHGHPATLSASLYNFVGYKMSNPDTGEIDYDQLLSLARQTKPKLIIAGFSSYPASLDYGQFVKIANEVGAITMADVSHLAGLIAAKVLDNPFDFGFDIITTTTHKTLRGPRGGLILVRDNLDLAKKIDKAVFPGIQGGPLMHQVAGKAVAFYEAMQPEFKQYAQNVLDNAKVMAEVFLENKARLIAGGTQNHLILCDVFSSFGVSGKEAQEKLESFGITVNKNVTPDDIRGSIDPSGIRFGTPAITTRGFGLEDCKALAQQMVNILQSKPVDKSILASLAKL